MYVHGSVVTATKIVTCWFCIFYEAAKPRVELQNHNYHIGGKRNDGCYDRVRVESPPLPEAMVLLQSHTPGQPVTSHCELQQQNKTKHDILLTVS